MSIFDQGWPRLAGVFGLVFGLGGGAASGDEVTFVGKGLDANLEGAFDVFAADVDGDGRTDVVASATTAGDVVWFRNPGGDLTGTWTKYEVDVRFPNAITVAAADIDGDGDMDLVAAGGAEIVWWENPGNALGGATWTEYLIDNSFSGVISLDVVDLNNDGAMDVLASSEFTGQIRWWKNPGGEDARRRGWREDTQIVSNFNGSHEVVARDVNGDGLMDVIGAASFDNEIAWWPNPGLASVERPQDWEKVRIAATFLGATAADVADIDGDGLMDIVGTAGQGAVSDDDVSWFRNPGGAAALDGDWVETVVEPTFLGAKNVAAGDVDGDGDVDIVGVAQLDGDLSWFDNPGGALVSNGASWVERVVKDDFTGAVGVLTADLDGDGDVDIAGASFTKNDVAVWINQTPIAPMVPDPRILSITTVSEVGGVTTFEIEFVSGEGVGYSVQGSGDLKTYTADTTVTGAAGTTKVQVTGNGSERYWRVGFSE